MMNETETLKRLMDVVIEQASQPITVQNSRNGWAGYQGTRRCTKFYFSQSAAQLDVDNQLNSEVPTQVVDR